MECLALGTSAWVPPAQLADIIYIHHFALVA